jgi:penicillin-binding protein 1A
MKVALAGQPALDFAAPQGVTLQQVPEPDGTMVTEAFKYNETPGAQSQNSLLGGVDTAPANAPLAPGSGPVTAGPPGTPVGPAATPQAIDKSLGGLY